LVESYSDYDHAQLHFAVYWKLDLLKQVTV